MILLEKIALVIIMLLNFMKLLESLLGLKDLNLMVLIMVGLRLQ